MPTDLTATERRFAEQLLAGHSTHAIATHHGLSPRTVENYLRLLRHRTDAPRGCAQPVLIHALITSGLLQPPTPRRPVPALAPHQEQLLLALATHSGARDIAHAVGIEPARLTIEVAALLTETGTASTTQLIGFAHSWALLDAGDENR
ncbi:DNA-binding protein [Streptomyces albus]|uniref:DNA-binding protein n=1 Tax=Streptomyces albus (strain ATCC 21838 / DSM 41398 / FERM P-419 / JCM 4703 / NBRC 107858) TaxID=1081613 RepID=A0A0B5F9I1_STRA4|nr:DNA-binding protein [Streptomyces albus]AOU81800.1 DNA-binding protein [Streptomyces albus]AYN37487.1 hypothetical protein DUI70_6994 [Streptomyces albus]